MNTHPHIPVLLEETISHLLTDPDGIYLDGTVGFGGHAEALLKKLSKQGRLIGMDLDSYALEYTEKRLSALQKSYSLHNENFREYPLLLNTLEIDKLTGIIIDLGSSSSQLNLGHRGFSFQIDAPLDMRFNQDSGMTAKEFLNSFNEQEISDVIKTYGEERHHRKISRTIVQAAKEGWMNTTFDLKLAVSKCVHPRFLTKSLARVFQAIRIKINDELDSLKEALVNSLSFLEVGGRITIISFHSIEDRIVKHFFKDNASTCTCPPEYPICQCNTIPLLKVLTRKSVSASQMEVADNRRSRSAKLRAAERI
jgi:16S rRNA (cytosine1402-N4)-methyltransferase